MSSTLAALQQRKERLDEELKQVEKQVYDLETTYLNDSSQYGNVLKGFEGFLSQTKNTSQKKARNFKPEDRLFSLSSTSSPVVDEIAAERAEATVDHKGDCYRRPIGFNTALIVASDKYTYKARARSRSPDRVKEVVHVAPVVPSRRDE